MDDAATLPDRRQTRYDRQLRLWGDHGQLALERAHVALVHATPTGTELLKNIVLPGIGSFTIFDDNLITPCSIGSNFFCEPGTEGSNRAEVACKLLQELNPDVRGNWVNLGLSSLLSDPSVLLKFTCVITAGVAEEDAAILERVLWEHRIPLVVCGCTGLVGWGRISVKEHCVIESRPDNSFDDLRVDAPFPGLQQLVSTLDLDSISRERHSHIPYVLLILKALDKWRSENSDRSFPASYDEKRAVRSILQRMRRPDEHGSVDQENFAEAVNNLNRVLRPSSIPSNVNAVFKDPECENVSADSSDFWLMARALRDFVNGDGKGRLPVNGALPDMTADTESYVALQETYRSQAALDMHAVNQHLSQLLRQVGRPADSISLDRLAFFCKHANTLKVLRSSRLRDPPDAADMATRLNSGDAAVQWLCAIRTVQLFVANAGRFPAADADLGALTKGWQLPPDTSTGSISAHLSELCRYGEAELHATAALVGAVMGHEVVKLCTSQFIPVEGTLLIDANEMRVQSVKL